ncbi:hypothetical protein KP509_30G056000 [Ceratopteris richardii]|uniref:Uncharacterized protein n=1 Tax=Ceratopteris richardii TaxID=49495 RepID=A0A8T2R4A3_CERRI|nr:hypothetical protein KP509_30G056000 [Ceratopteris richardii]
MASLSSSSQVILDAATTVNGVRPHTVRSRVLRKGRVPGVSCALTTCNIALSTRCSTEQQTIQNPVSTKTPVKAKQKENLPKLDDSGPGGGPRGGDGGGGGGGGGGGWAGGFALWAFLLLLSFIKEKENDKPYRQDNAKRKMREAYM